MTNTPLPLVTPGSYACGGTDNVSGFPPSGVLSILPSRSLVPLCNGWVLLGDRTYNKIDLMNVVTGAVSQTYALTGAPNEMAYDSANSMLYVGLDSASAMARINLSNGQVFNIPLSYPVSYLSIGPAGKVFVESNTTNPWWDMPIQLVDGLGGVTLATYLNLDQGFLTYDNAHTQLLMGQMDISSGPLYAFAYSAPATTITQTQTINTNGFIDGLALSPDCNHMAVMEGGAGVVDFNPTNFNITYGSWPGGVGPQGGAFSPDSANFVTGNDVGSYAGNFGVYVYSVASHAQEMGVTFTSSYYSLNRVGFSQGGKIIYAMVGNYTTPDSYQLYWYLYP
jgi:hypothetical protein